MARKHTPFVIAYDFDGILTQHIVMAECVLKEIRA